MVKKVRKVKKVKKVKKTKKKDRLDEAFGLFHSFSKKYVGRKITDFVEGEDLTLKETACLMLGFSMGEKEKDNG